MSKQNESGHAINVAHFENLLSICTTFGDAYNPNVDRLQLNGLTLMLARANEQMKETLTAKNVFDDDIILRLNIFSDLGVLATKVVNALAISGADKKKVEDAKGVQRKLQGKRAEKIPPFLAPVATAGIAMELPKTISVSQLSFDSKISHLSKLIELLSTCTAYNPNEPELKVIGLRKRLEKMKEINSRLIKNHNIWSNAVSKRNEVLYNKDSGLKAVAMDVKKYVKSAFGATSDAYRKVAGIEFKGR